MSQNPLNNLKIETPCLVNWETMQGDDRMRFCDLCQLNVYNLSAMSENEAIALLNEPRTRLCVRFYRDLSGNVVTQNCPQQISNGFLTSVKNTLRPLFRIAAVVSVISIISGWLGFSFGKAPSARQIRNLRIEHPPVSTAEHSKSVIESEEDYPVFEMGIAPRRQMPSTTHPPRSLPPFNH